MMNNDLISREALKKSIEELKKSPWYCEHRDTIDGIASRQAQKEAFQIVENTIDNAPTVKPKQGEWAKIGEIGLAYKCNKCGEVAVIPTNFCPNCGAKMKGGAK